MRALPYSRRRLGLALGGAALLAALLVGASQLTARSARHGGDEAAAATGTRPSASVLLGIPQQGPALGSPAAPLTLVEYADLQCPYCGYWARETLPVLVRRFVRRGALRIVFRGLAFIGPDSLTGLRTAVAAGHQDHLWDVVDGLYKHQGAENAGWIADTLVTEITSDVPAFDVAKALEERSDPSVDADIRRMALAAQAAGISATPSFELGQTNGRLDVIKLDSLDPAAIVPAIEAASR